MFLRRQTLVENGNRNWVLAQVVLRIFVFGRVIQSATLLAVAHQRRCRLGFLANHVFPKDTLAQRSHFGARTFRLRSLCLGLGGLDALLRFFLSNLQQRGQILRRELQAWYVPFVHCGLAVPLQLGAQSSHALYFRLLKHA